MIIFLLTLIAVCLILMVVWLGIMWKKIDTFLIWNTRYESAAYENTITTPKIKRPSAPASKTTQRGRSITPTEEWVDISDMPFEEAYAALEKIGE